MVPVSACGGTLAQMGAPSGPASTGTQLDEGLNAGGTLAAASYDGEVRIVSLLSNDSAPLAHVTDHIHRARGACAWHNAPDAKLLFQR